MPTVELSKFSKLNPIIDADSLVWNCGFMKSDDDTDDPPLAFFLNAVKRVIDSIHDVFPDRVKEWMFIGGTGNFRYDVATVRPYKGQRKQEKPLYYNEIREYLVDVHKAVIIDGEEADDAVGKTQWAHPDKSTCIVGQDKDLKTIPGAHYWWKLKVGEYLSRRDADNFFLRQMLTGDVSDNIQGVPKVGDKTADRIIRECGGDTKKILKAVEREYQRAYGQRWKEIMDEMGTLLHIRRVDGKVWQDFIN